MDAVRAVAIVGVVLGHWLVTALVLTPDGTLSVASPLRALPALSPATWLLQTLGLFFYAGGFAAARSHASARRRGQPYAAWLRDRLGRLAGPVLAFAAVWGGALLTAAAAGAPHVTLRTVAVLAVSPLWFLAPFAVLTALTGALRRAVRVAGVGAALPAVGVVALADAGVGALPLTVVAAWLVPYLLGIAVADGRVAHRRCAWLLALAGAAALAALVGTAGYPASAVGVPGATRSNLNPPSLLALALATGQIGVALLLRPWLRRRLTRRRWWRPVALVNLAAMAVYLWHQSALIGVTLAGSVSSAGAPLPGLHTSPHGIGWLAARCAWLPLFAAALFAATRLLAPGRPR